MGSEKVTWRLGSGLRSSHARARPSPRYKGTAASAAPGPRPHTHHTHHKHTAAWGRPQSTSLSPRPRETSEERALSPPFSTRRNQRSHRRGHAREVAHLGKGTPASGLCTFKDALPATPRSPTRTHLPLPPRLCKRLWRNEKGQDMAKEGQNRKFASAQACFGSATRWHPDCHTTLTQCNDASTWRVLPDLAGYQHRRWNYKDLYIIPHTKLGACSWASK